MASAERLLQFLEKQGISKRKFYTTVEVSNGYLDKSKNISADILERIIYSYPDINIMWVITGTGEMLKSDEKPADTPTSNNHVHEPVVTINTNTPVTISKGAASKLEKTVHPPVHPPVILQPKIITVDGGGYENILHVSIRSAAGYLAGHSDPEYLEKLPSFRLPGLTGKTYRSFEADGDSMDPTIKHGQMVIGEWVESLEDIKDDRVYIIVTKNSRPVIKRLLNRINTKGLIIAKSDATNNRELYKNYTINPDDILEVWYARFHGSFDFQAPGDMWKRVNNHEADITLLQSTVDKLMNVIKTAGLLNE
ncbi:S24/S26 family peptidase [Mucilaginibacter sp. SMC90]|uniref:S24 family peptidase n=1 Tax=Mucilaginibacter sp. SMC90 TaxID=2929803 RepID=UPI001FB34345|nr:S24/S26 family peptidase [Mucilaginibacter sp. SMC90]UOE48022.1 S24/S26 family peptidase [Mucilaginibacter sp. SMC90]